MTTSTAMPRTGDGSATAPRPRARWPYAGPAQLRLLLASLAVVIGSFLPWVDTAFGSFTGLAGPGVWTLYAGILGIGGSLVRRPRLAAVHAVATGVAAVALAGWQGLRLVDVCGGGACAPSSGLFMVAIGGVTAAVQARALFNFRPGGS